MVFRHRRQILGNELDNRAVSQEVFELCLGSSPVASPIISQPYRRRWPQVSAGLFAVEMHERLQRLHAFL